MIVYGDPQFQQRLGAFIRRLSDLISNCNPDSLDTLRAALVQCGQLEQAVDDHVAEGNGATPGSAGILPASSALVRRIRTATDCAAMGYYQVWRFNRSATAPLRGLAKALEDVADTQTSDPLLTFKVPEGFAFYALFPEQFCAAAEEWVSERRFPNRLDSEIRNQRADLGIGAPQKRALVIGIRSIGTTLSAAVTAVLLQHGWKVQRFTVRPGGDPFRRRVQLPEVLLRDAKSALVVDEGPGISGSSMAAVAFELRRQGIQEIAFLPGHAGEPGGAASTEVREIWSQVRRYFVPLEQIRWEGEALTELLARRASAHFGTPFDPVTEVSAGRWRKFAFENEADWPAIAPQFERMKFLCSSRGGSSVLWKFAGLACAAKVAQAFPLASSRRGSTTPLPCAEFHGFIATPWIQGRRLSRADGSESVVRHIARHILSVAQSATSEADSHAAISRLAEMLFWNTKESLGDIVAEQTRVLADAARQNQTPLCYGDGRLAPQEWVRSAAGSIVKTDCGGHDCDHTMIGRQSVLWDVAGAMVEWDLDAHGKDCLLQPFREAGLRIQGGALRFHEAAYAAFRLGVMRFAAQQIADPAEHRRIEIASEFYRDRLASSLMRNVGRQAARSETELARSSHPSSPS